MKAIYQGRLATIIDDYGDGIILSFDDGKTARVAFGAASLVVDPTDDQVAAARAGKPIPADPEFDREVKRDSIRMLMRVAADKNASPEARANAKAHLRELRKKH